MTLKQDHPWVPEAEAVFSGRELAYQAGMREQYPHPYPPWARWTEHSATEHLEVCSAKCPSSLLGSSTFHKTEHKSVKFFPTLFQKSPFSPISDNMSLIFSNTLPKVPSTFVFLLSLLKAFWAFSLKHVYTLSSAAN